jgi:hypothetical protein
VNVLLRVFHLEEKKLGDNRVRHKVVNWRADEDNPIPKQATVDVPSPLLATFAFINVRKR